jgi:hypothetical protein
MSAEDYNMVCRRCANFNVLQLAEADIADPTSKPPPF